MNFESNEIKICKLKWVSDKHTFYFEFSAEVTRSSKYSDMVIVQQQPEILLPYKIIEDKYLDIGGGECKYEIVSIKNDKYPPEMILKDENGELEKFTAARFSNNSTKFKFKGGNEVLEKVLSLPQFISLKKDERKHDPFT